MAERSTCHRTLFLSDLHLGSRRCMARSLHRFLARNRAETLVLVGDTFDFWAMRRGGLPLFHQAALAGLVDRARAGTRLILLPGNHDDTLHALHGLPLDGVSLLPSFVHEAADGRQYLVTHGDHLDPSLQSLRGLARNAAFLCERLPHLLSRFPAAAAGLKALWRDLGHWQGKPARFAERLIAESHARGLDGVICGHIHAPERRQTDRGLYLNCGDWVSHGTAIAEDFSGAFHLLTAPMPQPRTSAALATRRAEAA